MSRHSLNKKDVTWRMVYRMFFLRPKICVPKRKNFAKK